MIVNTENIEEYIKKINLTNDGLFYRQLEIEDYNKNYFDLLSQLTIAGKPDFEEYKQIYKEMHSDKLNKVFVVEDITLSKVIANINCHVEQKLIRNLGKVCHIEEFIIDSEYRNKKIGNQLLQLAVTYAKEIKCYKIILNCSDNVVEFYEKNGFTKSTNGMSKYI
jgi:glucosamine-phosphate N-acetyltransferase